MIMSDDDNDNDNFFMHLLHQPLNLLISHHILQTNKQKVQDSGLYEASLKEMSCR